MRIRNLRAVERATAWIWKPFEQWGSLRKVFTVVALCLLMTVDEINF